MNFHDSRKSTNQKQKFPFRKKVVIFFQKNKKNIKYFIIFVLLLITFLYPVFSGTIVGNWIKDFFGTIIGIVKTI
jgi:hypothetical protein